MTHHTKHELIDRVALVTGANPGIGAATAIELAARGAAVLVTFLRFPEAPAEAGVPPAYGSTRARDAEWVLDTIRAAGGTAEAVEADLADPTAPGHVLAAAEAALGPVEILICNASGWVQTRSRRRATIASNGRCTSSRPKRSMPSSQSTRVRTRC